MCRQAHRCLLEALLYLALPRALLSRRTTYALLLHLPSIMGAERRRRGLPLPVPARASRSGSPTCSAIPKPASSVLAASSTFGRC